MAENQLMERQNNESGEEEQGVYWVYWRFTVGGGQWNDDHAMGEDGEWRANFLDHESYVKFVTLSNNITITDQGWYETL